MKYFDNYVIEKCEKVLCISVQLTKMTKYFESFFHYFFDGQSTSVSFGWKSSSMD